MDNLLKAMMRRVPPHSYGEVAASYADGGVIGDAVLGPMTPPLRITGHLPI